MVEETQGQLSSTQLLQERQRLEKLYQEQYTRTITVLFTDLVDSTALTEAQGDMSARELIRTHLNFLFPIIETNNGTLVKTMGDGTMSYFEHAQDAQRTAVAFQVSLKLYNDQHTTKVPINVRIGAHTGVGIVEEDDIYGDVVNVAARFEALARSGEIYISDSCYLALENKGEFYSRIVKEASLKGKSETYTVYKVFWDEAEIDHDKENYQHETVKTKSSFSLKALFRIILFISLLLITVYGVMKLTAFLENPKKIEEKRSRSNKVSLIVPVLKQRTGPILIPINQEIIKVSFLEMFIRTIK